MGRRSQSLGPEA